MYDRYISSIILYFHICLLTRTFLSYMQLIIYFMSSGFLSFLINFVNFDVLND